MIDINDFEQEYSEALAAASEFSRRAQKGIPPDRWASTSAMQLVAKGIWAQQQIISALADFVQASVEAQADSMDVFNKRGERT